MRDLTSKERQDYVAELVEVLSNEEYWTARDIFAKLVTVTGKVSKADEVYGEARRIVARANDHA